MNDADRLAALEIVARRQHDALMALDAAHRALRVALNAEARAIAELQRSLRLAHTKINTMFGDKAA